MTTFLHKQNLPENIEIAVISISTTRGLSEDKSGTWIKKQAKKEGHEVVVHQTVTDDIDAIRELALHVIDKICPDAIIMTGGTGISPKDVTIEAVRPLFEKELTAFGTLFTQLSFEEIDSAAILSRATAGIIKQTMIFCMPGSIKACKLACNSLIFPELGHLLKHIKE
ncbi:MAG: molybdenum cofactor biosynthesis protein MoaB [Desulfobacula sp.]|jgi:molybdenum cofactor biosynthesis protein B|uniref:MogA/MoaB family molybdenum cofactor biosynthesis protein n=1 Tax=Desulfobacula sp. TaxID=2593537 RepID=UPI001DB08756|nr:molybdenum cofactor biosynthesis protein MoaB [Desulfobacula sp.]MBT3485041.1 molybdenum cofactor biosynthesis protein MoaB [Desulfobacula sp.]MBT3804142.1 molybdenum cofactor biosynthesis protein MoaB [Desulfobacula sp.]MBT4024998.1 molybdenum cofactor biosynthesis protein MoaB [Desulfobacula sp.]MBT4198692.1 molybdenum cofactor biosynthesis protein MoaB [Desulfobacula sp.]